MRSRLSIGQDISAKKLRRLARREGTPEVVAARAVSMATTGQVVSLEGEPVSVSAETLCVHSDTPGADRLGPAVRQALEAAGVTLGAA
jgi:UPF0271 protein